MGCIMVRLFFATSNEVHSASSIIFIFSYRAEESQNISTTCPGESREQKALAVSGQFADRHFCRHKTFNIQENISLSQLEGTKNYL